VRVCVIRGAWAHGGGDVTVPHPLQPLGGQVTTGRGDIDPEVMAGVLAWLPTVLSIAVVEGRVAPGLLELVLGCDLALVSTAAELPIERAGRGAELPAVALRRLGEGLGRQAGLVGLLVGGTLDADAMVTAGLALGPYPPADLDAAVLSLVGCLLRPDAAQSRERLVRFRREQKR